VLPFYLFCCFLLYCQAQPILLGIRLKACNSFWQQAEAKATDNSQLGTSHKASGKWHGGTYFAKLLRKALFQFNSRSASQ